MTARHLYSTLAVSAVCAFLGACGGSDKPGYCSDVDNFKDAVSGLGNVQITQNGISSLTTAVNKVESSGRTLVASAKGAFPAETGALNASLTALGATVQQLGNSATASAALKALPAEVLAVNSAFKSLSSAAKDKCD